MVSHTAQFRRLLREAKETVHELHDLGRSTKALEIELRRGEEAVEARRWDEARSHLDRVLKRRGHEPARDDESYDPSPVQPGASEPSGSAAAVNGTAAHAKPDSVRRKLRMVRERITLLNQFGADTEGMIASLVRAEEFLGKGYIASAESIAEELLVLSKASAEGVRAKVAPNGADKAGEGAADFLGLLRGSLADLVSAQGWIDEGRARTLIDEALADLPRWGDFKTRLADDARAHGAALELVAENMRRELAHALARAEGTADEQARAQAELRAGLEAASESSAEHVTRAVQHEHALRKVDDACRANGEALAKLTELVEESRRTLATRVDAAALADLGSLIATLRHEVGNRAAASDLATVRDSLGHDITALRLQQQESLSQLDTRVADRMREAVSGLDQRLAARMEMISEHGQVLINLEEALDDLRQAQMGKADAAAVATIATELDGAMVSLRRELAGKGDVEAIAAMRGAVAELATRLVAAEKAAGSASEGRLAEFEAALAGLRERIDHDDSSALLAGRVSSLSEQVGRLAHGGAVAEELRAEHATLRRQVDDLAAANDGRSPAADALAELRAEHAAERAALRDRLESLAGEVERFSPLRDAVDEMRASMAGERAALRKRIESLAADAAGRVDADGVAGAMRADLAAAESRWSEALTQLRQSVESALPGVDDLAGRMKQVEEKLASGPRELTARLERLDQRIGALTAKTSETTTIRSAAAAIAALKATVAAQERSIIELERRVEAVAASGAVPTATVAAAADDERLASLAEAISSRAAELEARLAALEGRPAAKPEEVDEQALIQKVVEMLKPMLPKGSWISEQIQGAVQAAVAKDPGAALDAKQLRKMMPDLLSTPEARGTIVTEVILEALSGRSQLGDLTGVRAAVREELQRILAEGKGQTAA